MAIGNDVRALAVLLAVSRGAFPVIGSFRSQLVDSVVMNSAPNKARALIQLSTPFPSQIPTHRCCFLLDRIDNRQKCPSFQGLTSTAHLFLSASVSCSAICLHNSPCTKSQNDCFCLPHFSGFTLLSVLYGYAVEALTLHFSVVLFPVLISDALVVCD